LSILNTCRLVDNMKTGSLSDISLWKQLSRERAEAVEAERQQVFKSVCRALTILSEHYDWEEIFIFGSVTKPTRFSSRYSDIDIGVRGLNKFLHYRFVGEISMLLDRDVDVVRLEDCPFAETIINRGIRWTKGMQ
jgi:predicted nucleotidyltransferase